MPNFTPRLALIGLALGTFCLVASGDTISSVYVSLGPIPSSSSYSGYTTDAQTGVQNGGISVGNIALTPTGYNQMNNITNADINFDTAFNNWRGTANPLPPFNNEFGTALYFSVVIKAAPGVNSLSLSNITYTESSTDPFDYFAFVGSFSGSNYAADKAGILANGTQVASGTSGSTLVNEIVLTDVGLGFDVTGQYTGTPQQQLNAAIADEAALGVYQIQACFSDSADGLSSCGTANVNGANAVPEPATFGFLGLGLAVTAFAYRRFRTQRS